MSDCVTEPDSMPQRLCSEIQLFDLCELSSCSFRKERFCTSPVLLERFEKIADDELRAQELYRADESDADTDDEDVDGDGDEFSLEKLSYGDEEEYEE